METNSTRTIDTKVDSRLERIEERLEDSMGATANINEIQDRQRRKANLIVFGLPESEKEDRNEKNVEETEKFEALCKDNLGLKTKVKTATRLGPFADNQARPRPIERTVQSQDCRNKILKAAIKLKDTEDDIAKKIFINKDMTLLERTEDQKLRKERNTKIKQFQQSGDVAARWVIRRGKVVNLKKKRRRGGRAGLKSTTTPQKNVNSTALTKFGF